jgi:hypothetical protein
MFTIMAITMHDQAHEQERAELREITLGGVAVEAHGAERGGRYEEHRAMLAPVKTMKMLA